MKMKEFFKLPLVINEEDAQSGAKSWWLSDSRRNEAISDMELFDEAEAICEAVNSHDRLESANRELLEALAGVKDVCDNWHDLGLKDIGQMKTAVRVYTKHSTEGGE